MKQGHGCCSRKSNGLALPYEVAIMIIVVVQFGSCARRARSTRTPFLEAIKGYHARAFRRFAEESATTISLLKVIANLNCNCKLQNCRTFVKFYTSLKITKKKPPCVASITFELSPGDCLLRKHRLFFGTSFDAVPGWSAVACEYVCSSVQGC